MTGRFRPDEMFVIFCAQGGLAAGSLLMLELGLQLQPALLGALELGL
jgi:hypothetical protein